MIDFHSHILPEIDDGSCCLEEAIRMLNQEQYQGVHRVLATPHFYADCDSVHLFLQRRKASIEKVRQQIGENGNFPDIHLGAEVHYFSNMGQAKLLSELCMDGTSILLLELPFTQWTERILRDVEQILKIQKLTVILAHVERYYEFQKSKAVWSKMFELPLYAQINAGGFLNRKRRKFCLNFLQEYQTAVLGSDCHNMKSRPPNLSEGREIIRQKLGDEMLQHIDALGSRMLEDYE